MACLAPRPRESRDDKTITWIQGRYREAKISILIVSSSGPAEKRSPFTPPHPTQPPEISPDRGPPQWDEADLTQDSYQYPFDQTVSW
jgi:hypothetical protein